MQPLQRKPKVLDSEPVLVEASSLGIALPSKRGASRATARSGGAASAATDDAAGLTDPQAEAAGIEPELERRVHEIAERLSIPRPRVNARPQRGSGVLRSLPFAGGSDDLDLDKTLERLLATSLPQDEDIVVRERVQTRHSVVLLVDVSGSMRGERVRTMAATVAALARELIDDDLAVLAFWSDGVWLQHLGQQTDPFALLDRILAIPVRGLTNLDFPLQQARIELSGRPRRSTKVILLSDCVHNAGPDPRSAAAGLSQLSVLLDASGEHDAALGSELALRGHGRFSLVRSHRQVAAALGTFFRP
jgi:Mg-chelatase subunit ChlD